MSEELRAQLYLVPTPIGNLGDMTLRAIDVLRNVDLILAEDTRVTGKLLKHFEITTPMMSFHQNNEHRKLDEVLEKMRDGRRIACCSDAGSPSISDPGFLLTRACVQHGMKIEALPGATAAIPALMVSGLPSDRFVFEGFLPSKSGKRARMGEIAERPITSVLYESPHRLVKTLKQLMELTGEDRQVVVCRELTKLHEEIVRGTILEAMNHFENHSPKGEFVLIVAGKS